MHKLISKETLTVQIELGQKRTPKEQDREKKTMSYEEPNLTFSRRVWLIVWHTQGLFVPHSTSNGYFTRSYFEIMFLFSV